MVSDGVSMSKAILLAGLGYGDEGKGTITEYLVAKNGAHTVVRYNGGAQAAHNVVTDEGRHHTFSQFGSGTLVGAKTYLSRFMLVDPLALMAEARHLTELNVDPFRLISVDQDALVITPWARAANRILERSRGDNKHGSVGVGVGQTQADFIKFGRGLVLTIGDLMNRDEFMVKASFIREQKIEQVLELDHGPEGRLLLLTPEDMWDRYRSFVDNIRIVDTNVLESMLRDGVTVFEGAQGVLLDQDYGFQPYTTWSDTTFANAQTLLRFVGFGGEIERVGVTRTYSSRHGAGPMVTNDGRWGSYDEKHNSSDNWQGSFKTGPLDLVALRYATEVLGGIDYVAVTHMDKVRPVVCSDYSLPSGILPGSEDARDFFNDSYSIKVKRPFDMKHQERLSNVLWHCAPNIVNGFNLDYIASSCKAKIGIVSYGPSLMHKDDV